ncbi:MAG: hypothetical protein A2W90_17415 [Bacteroidetes bacterium GWF2_42_66]|nr:MAG: hypothetical protein A2W92_21345 [Bacteroidetes bacterium GWA2_42_15]OFX97674.1 MAG: hypothetical protein A2W89_19550 [Bacteroidetes bacterium GWE2_42_39]OFY46922.1 MAG: hypothetical protein A2W90_17415 [Bacteroidetes bacterium GWF2_42_66]HBL75715.1 hypothetical protein [Prolixibacteraceae bacterium]HCR91800.1 hypothetical protein [Prolixibacteraceae bacterium]
MDTNNSIRERIIAYFNGRLSNREETSLCDWIKESNENKAFFLQVKNEFTSDEAEHPLLESSYAELKSKLLINRQLSVPSVKLRKLQLSFSRIAALIVLAVILGGVVTWLLTNSPVKKPEVVWFETQVPRGEKSQLLLPDGSKVWMNSESSLSYPSDFMKGNRNVKLKGEAYFEVEKQNGSVFTVATQDYTIRVLGTKFNVTGYADFNRTETTLIEGSIEVQRGKQTVSVVPGQTLIYKDNRFLMEETNAVKSAKWKDNIFDFNRISFRELVLRLERWYDVDIEMKSPQLNDIVYSGVFKNEETIEEVLNVFQLTMPITYVKEDFRKISIQIKE